MTARQHMTPQEFRAALERLDLTPSAFAALVGSNDKNMRRAAEDGSDGPGPAASFALRLMLTMEALLETRATPEDWAELAADRIERALAGDFEL